MPCSCKLITKKLAVLLFSVSCSSAALLVRSKRLDDNCRVALVAPHTSEVLHFHGRVCLLRCILMPRQRPRIKSVHKSSAISQKNKYSSERSPIQSALNQKRLEARFAVVPALDEFCHIKARREQNKDGAQQIGSREACEWHEWGWQFKTHLWFPTGASSMRDYATAPRHNYNY